MRTVTIAALSFLLPFSVLHCGGNENTGETPNGNNTATIEGAIEDGGGSQPQRDLGGSGSIAASTDIKVSTIGADGSLTTVATAKVTAGGAFSIKVPPNKKNMIIQATDTSGSVQVSAIIEKSGAKDSTTKLAPLTTESSVEADVLVQMYVMGESEANANSIDLRARINANVAAAVKASTNRAAAIKALAEATAAAQHAQVKAYADASLSQEALFDLQLSAAATLNAALNAKQDADDAYAAFHASVDAALKAKGMTEEKRAHAEARAELTFRAAVKARINNAADAVYDASVRASTTLQARTETVAVQAALTASGASQAALDAAAAASAALRTDLAASASANASAAAYVAYHDKLVGGASVEGSVWDVFADINVANQITIEAAVAAAVAAQVALDAAIEASIAVSGVLDIDASAQAVLAAYATFETNVKAQQAALEAAFPGKGSASISLLMFSHASFKTN